VGSFSPQGDSPYGCADMAGNVFEWCSTLLRPYPYDPADGREDPKSAEPRVVLLPNKYDPNRAHLAVYNFAQAPQVSVKMAQFLKAGDKVRLLDPKDFYGKPVWEGTAAGETLSVPTPGEFAVYVVLKGK
jgi:hypothetical protein